MRGRVTTLRDVADRAGVSPTTVTRLINAHGFVSRDARAAIRQAIDDLGYVPSALPTPRPGTADSRSSQSSRPPPSRPRWPTAAWSCSDSRSPAWCPPRHTCSPGFSRSP
ncbi:LacI family DNA-binding transcriptional regulator [Isoptericola sp. NEAU-Y5]|uniref:LacI family DNA-binding transcriptional regulator n=1 Tax=Isoptericola luteus TaxID=2879484 RepID=A0ABS7Z9J6_9MICO|nr:LacI family DNA-binding transcriptional regulator [Isoptericola sp. NEAU-Y5]MCA5894571.1 LacI family DNA-binding transcriptional regulator [Isoptericola sp. NEAU-Y5]